MLINQETILPDSNPVLREKCAEVDLPLSKEDEETLMAMITYVRDSKDEEKAEKYNLRAAVGIAAPQIGILKRMIAISIQGPEDEPPLEYALVNPKIISNSTQMSYLESGESCLSVPEDHDGFVPRYARITVTGYDLLTKQDVKLRLRGYPAVVFQHEIDHLSGILYYDHINKSDPFQPIEDAIVI